MAKVQEETSTSQPSVSNLVSSMSMEELRSFCHILDIISLEVLDGPTISTIGDADSAAYFTWEQFMVGLRFPMSSLVKQFLHVSPAPPTLIHPNVIRILMGCSVLNCSDS